MRRLLLIGGILIAFSVIGCALIPHRLRTDLPQDYINFSPEQYQSRAAEVKAYNFKIITHSRFFQAGTSYRKVGSSYAPVAAYGWTNAVPSSGVIYADERFLWMAIRGGGILQVDTRNGTYRGITVNNGQLFNELVRCIRGAPDGTIWIGTADGITVCDPRADTWTHYNKQTTGEKFDRVRVNDLCFMDDEVIIATENKGVYIYNRATDQWIHKGHDGDIQKIGLSSGNIGYEIDPKGLGVNSRCVYQIERSGNILWFLTRRGLSRWDRAADKWTYHGKKHRFYMAVEFNFFTDDVWYGGTKAPWPLWLPSTMAVDDKGDLWLGFPGKNIMKPGVGYDYKGLGRGALMVLHRDTGKWEEIDRFKKVGIYSLRSHNHKIYVGSDNGASVYEDGKWREFFIHGHTASLTLADTWFDSHQQRVGTRGKMFGKKNPNIAQNLFPQGDSIYVASRSSVLQVPADYGHLADLTPFFPFYQDVDWLVAHNKFDKAYQVIQENKEKYGEKNAVLYHGDAGIIAHLAKEYEKSIDHLLKAETMVEELYTTSISNQAVTLLLNDTAAPYRGEDFESVMYNLYLALNYYQMGQTDEALVEARKVDKKLEAINSCYDVDNKNAYKEDAFVRMLMGIIYEAGGTNEDMNDAFISYRRAEDIYEKDYRVNYGLKVPRFLKESLLSTAQYMGGKELEHYRQKYSDIEVVPVSVMKEKAEIYFVHYNGLSPAKVEDKIVLPPLPDGYIVKIAFPKYKDRSFRVASSSITLSDGSGTRQVHTSCCEDLGAIAVKNLVNRKGRIMAKAVARATTKYLVTKGAEKLAEDQFGGGAGLAVKILGNIITGSTEKADTRCWQSLPAEIRMARAVVNPGTHKLKAELRDRHGQPVKTVDLGQVDAKAGERKFVIFRTLD